MSGLGQALQNIGAQWSNSINARAEEERLYKKQQVLERLRAQNNQNQVFLEYAMALRKDKELRKRDKEDQKALYNSPAQVEARKLEAEDRERKRRLDEAEIERRQSQARKNDRWVPRPPAGSKSSKEPTWAEKLKYLEQFL